MSDHDEYTLDPQHWVERYGDYLFNYAAGRVSDRERAEDLVQETFLAALKGRERYRGDSTERTWLTSILKYWARSITRSLSLIKKQRGSMT